MKLQIIWIIILLAIVGAVYYSVDMIEAPVVPGQDVEEVVNEDGETEIIVEDDDASREEPVATGGCYVGGCSSQICSDQPDAVSTCEFREAYACYQTAKCERQTSGQCGWTETAELRMCLNAAN